MLAVASLGIGGCSYIQLHHYATPSASAGETRYDTESRCGWNPGTRFSGPPDRLLIRSGELVVGVQAQASRITTFTVGPLFLPVLPAIPPSAFPNQRLGDADRLAIDFRVIEPAYEEVDFSQVVVELVDPDDSITRYDLREAHDIAVPYARWTSAWRLADGFGIQPSAGEEPRTLRLRVSGISYDGVSHDLPEITLTPARGWMMCDER